MHGQQNIKIWGSLEDGDKVILSNVGNWITLRSCRPQEDFVEYCHRENFKTLSKIPLIINCIG